MARGGGVVTRTFDDIKKLASRPTDVVSLCLAGELVEEHARLERALATAAPATSLGEASPKRAIAEQILTVQEQMAEATIDFHLRALPARQWNLFWIGRPERGEDEDAEDYEPRLFTWQAEMVSRTCVEPEMTVEQVGELVDLLHAYSWTVLATRVTVLNMGEVDVPNSAAASELTRDSEQT